MKRVHVFLAVVAAVMVAAVALRVHSIVNRPRITLQDRSTSAPAGLRLGPPPDYVVEPVVAPEEHELGPRRIISLAPSITEVVCALGMRDRLVGRTPYGKHPPGIESIPSVGAVNDANFERIRALQPDRILVTSNSSAVIDGLRKLELPFTPVPHETFEQVFDSIEVVGRACARPRSAAMLIEAIRQDLQRLEARVRPRRTGRVAAMVCLGELPVPPQAVWVAGPGSFLEALLTRAGGTNAVSDELQVSFGEIALARIRTIDPQVILEFREPVRPKEMVALYESWSRVGDLQAIAHQRVYSVGGPEWLSAGPRVGIALYRFIVALDRVVLTP